MTDLAPGTAVFETDFVGEAKFYADRLGPDYAVTAGVDTLYAVRVRQPEQLLPGVVTKFDPKPIPLRTFDWEARQEGGDEHSVIGFGATEVAAIADLLIELESA